MATTSPDNIYSPDAGQQYALTQDLLAMADSVQAALKFRVGTSAVRAAWTDAVEGSLFYDTTLRELLFRYGGVWTARTTRGLFAASTSPTGTATVSHRLPSAPTNVLITDRNGGAIPGSRKIVVGAISESQIQFVVYSGNSVLADNPVQFYWQAYL